MTRTDPSPTVPEHFFISFSQDDRAIAEAIVRALRSKNIPAWIDYAQLAPGTPDWEAAIREAIGKSFAVVVLASPRARASRYVRGELTLAASHDCQIYPVWIDGTEWSDCVPLEMAYAQFIDARGEKLDQGIAELCAVLEQHARGATPKHYLVSPFRRRVGSKRDGSVKEVSPPPGFVSVEVSENENAREEGGEAIFIRASDYSSVHAFLDDLYINYLTQRFKPFAYGSSWILEGETGRGYSSRFLLPWTWLLRAHSSFEMESKWLHDTPLGDCGIGPHTSWRIRTTANVQPTGLAINDERIFQAICNSPKAEYFFRDRGVLADCPLAEIGPDYRFRFLISHRRFFGGTSQPGMAIVQTPQEIPEDFLRHWLQ